MDLSTTKTYRTEISGSLWLSVNAFYNGQIWQQVDDTKPSTAVEIDANGTVSTYIAKAGVYPLVWSQGQSAVKYEVATGAVAQSLVAGIGTFVAVQYASEVYDNLGEFNAGTYTFKATQAGIYSIDATLAFTAPATAGEVILTVYKNGAEDSRLVNFEFGTTAFAVGGSTKVHLNAGDTVTIQVATSQALTTAPGNATNQLSVAKIA